MRRWLFLTLTLLVFSGCSSMVAPGTTVTPLGSDTSMTAPSTSSSTSTTTTATQPSTTTTAPASELPLEGKVIVLDPGHNGMNWAFPEEINKVVDIGTGTKACNTTGTAGADGYAEPDFTWAVALLAKAELEKLGATVTLTRSDNEGWGPCITERAAIGNRYGEDAVISIHADGGPTTGRGFHVIYPKVVAGYTDDIAEASERLAESLRTAYLTTGIPVADYVGSDGFSVRDDLGGLTLSDSPVVFLEAGNMKSPADLTLLESPTFQQVIANAIATALVDFLG